MLLNIAFDKVTPSKQDDLKRRYEDILAEFIQEKYNLKTSDWKALYDIAYIKQLNCATF